jgi:hypothetical protein
MKKKGGGESLGRPAGAHTTAVDDRRLPPVRRGGAGPEHPEGAFLDGFCLNKPEGRTFFASCKAFAFVTVLS